MLGNACNRKVVPSGKDRSLHEACAYKEGGGMRSLCALTKQQLVRSAARCCHAAPTRDRRR